MVMIMYLLGLLSGLGLWLAWISYRAYQDLKSLDRETYSPKALYPVPVAYPTIPSPLTITFIPAEVMIPQTSTDIETHLKSITTSRSRRS